jgi:hypothetical protein
MANETFTANQTTVATPGFDADNDGVIDPGEQVTTTVTITNNSTNPTPVAATGVQFNEILDGMTTSTSRATTSTSRRSPSTMPTTWSATPPSR